MFLQNQLDLKASLLASNWALLKRAICLGGIFFLEIQYIIIGLFCNTYSKQVVNVIFYVVSKTIYG